MSCDLLINQIDWILRDLKMTVIMGFAVALGVVYACFTPWFYCNPYTSEEESRSRNDNESEVDETSFNRTITSTNIRITGLRGLNFVSVTLPKKPSVSRTSSRKMDHSSSIRQSNATRNSFQHLPIAYSSANEQQPIPEIQISSVSIDATNYSPPIITSSRSLVDVRSTNVNRVSSADSNNSQCDIIRSGDSDDNSTRDSWVRQISQPKIRKPPRAHPPLNSRLSQPSISRSHNSLPLPDVMNNTNQFRERKNSRVLSIPEIPVEKSSDYSLYPHVNVITKANDSSITTPMSSDNHQKFEYVVERQNSISDYYENSPKIIGSTDQFHHFLKKSQRTSDKSQIKSKISNFFRKKCKILCINMNKNNEESSRESENLSTLSNQKNKNSLGHSSFEENLNFIDGEYEDMKQKKCKSKKKQELFEDSRNEAVNIKNSKHATNKQNYIPEGIPHPPPPNLYQLPRIPSPISSDSFQGDIIYHRFPSYTRRTESFEDEPLDLSTKLRKYPENKCTEDYLRCYSSDGTTPTYLSDSTHYPEMKLMGGNKDLFHSTLSKL